jgi:hypothetical protein
MPVIKAFFIEIPFLERERASDIGCRGRTKK